MSTLHHTPGPVHSNPPLTFTLIAPDHAPPDEVLDADAAWWAATLAEEEEAAAATAAGTDDDRSWFRTLAADAKRYTGALDPFGVRALAADVLDDLVLDMTRLRAVTAAAWLDHPATRFTPAQADALAPPTAWTFGSGLAEGLDSLASYHVGEGSTADRLFALLVLERARDAETFGARTYDQLVSAEVDELAEAEGDSDHLWN